VASVCRYAVLGWVRQAARSHPMIWSSLGLICGKSALMGLGFLFWLVAARRFPVSEVGLTAGAISAIMLGVQLSLFGVGSAFITRYPRHQRQPTKLLDTAISIVTVAALLFAVAFLLLASGVFTELRVVGSMPAYAVLFTTMSVLGTVGTLFDQVSMAQGRGGQIVTRSLLNGVLTLAPVALLPVAAGAVASLELFATWVAGGLGACVLAFVQLGRRPTGYRYRPRMSWPIAKDLVKVGLPNQLLTLAERAPGLILPIVVTELLSPAANAYWYTTWMMAWGVYVIPTSMGIGLLAEAAHRPSALGAQVRRAVGSSLTIGIAAGIILAAVADPVLSLVGRPYAEAGVTPLRVLVLGVVPLSFIQAYFSACRATGHLREAIVTGVVTGAAGISATAAAGVVRGLTGMAVCWVFALVVASLWSIWRLRRLLRQNGEDMPSGRRVGRPVAQGSDAGSWDIGAAG
jgi:O-antigen/teichoic acid export membrane protein